MLHAPLRSAHMPMWQPASLPAKCSPRPPAGACGRAPSWRCRTSRPLRGWAWRGARCSRAACRPPPSGATPTRRIRPRRPRPASRCFAGIPSGVLLCACSPRDVVGVPIDVLDLCSSCPAQVPNVLINVPSGGGGVGGGAAAALQGRHGGRGSGAHHCAATGLGRRLGCARRRPVWRQQPRLWARAEGCDAVCTAIAGSPASQQQRLWHKSPTNTPDPGLPYQNGDHAGSGRLCAVWMTSHDGTNIC